MDPTPTADRHQRERAALRGALLALLVLAPLPFGSVQPWAVLTLEVAASGLGAWAVLLLVREPGGIPRYVRWLLALAMVPAAVGAFQLLPLPEPLLQVLAPSALEARKSVAAILPETASRAWPLSLSPPETLDAVVRYAAWLLVGLAAAAAFTDRPHLRSAAATLAAAGAFQALYGSAEYLSGHQHIFGYAKRYYTEEATGTFVNRNHFAEYLALTLPLALLLMAEGPRSEVRGGWRESLLRFSEGAGLRRAAGFAAAALIWTGVILSYSRGGLSAALVATALFGWCTVSRKWQGIALALVLLLPTSYLLWQEVRAPGERFFDEARGSVSTLGGRVPVWKQTLPIVAEAPLTGTGMGTFEAAFARHRHADVRNRWDHAHNDWLQSLAEGGPLTTLSLLGLFVLAVRMVSTRSPFTSKPSPASAALLASLGAAALHGFVDFGVRVPALAVTVAALLGMSGAVVPREPAGTRATPGRMRWLLLALPAAAATLGIAVHDAQALPERWVMGRGSWWVAPPARALDALGDQHLEEALAILNDTARPPKERLGGYRERLRIAQRLFVGSLAVNPAQPRTLTRLAAVRFELDPPLAPEQTREYAAMLELASRTASEDPQIQARIGELLLKMGRRQNALPYLRRAVELHPSSAGRVIAILRENLFAAEEILEELGLSSGVLVALRQASDEDGKVVEYASHLERALAAPTAALLAAYGETCRKLHEPDRLLATLDRIGRLDEPSLEAERLRQRALALLALGDHEEALTEARAAAALGTEEPSYQQHLARVALAAGRTEEALEGFRRALILAARTGASASYRATLCREIGQTEERAGRPDRAYDAYRRALKLSPQEPHSARRIAEMQKAAGVSRKERP